VICRIRPQVVFSSCLPCSLFSAIKSHRDEGENEEEVCDGESEDGSLHSKDSLPRCFQLVAFVLRHRRRYLTGRLGSPTRTLLALLNHCL